jgi:D-xylonolactonase
MPPWRKIDREQRDILGEGTVWSARENALYWTDILGPALNRLNLASGEVTRWAMPEPIGWVVERSRGGFIAGFQSGFAVLELDPLHITPIGNPEPDLPNNRMNDGKADSSGAIWCGTMDCECEGTRGSLYRLAADRQWQRIDSGYGVTNGPAFSPDGQWLYHTDTIRRVIYRFARTADGAGVREEFIRFAEADGAPDGMTVDAQGYLWVAHWGGSRVSRFAPDGSFDRAIALPARQATNIAFAGPALDRLFVTSAANGLPPSEYDGALFEIDPGGATGVPPGIYPG